VLVNRFQLVFDEVGADRDPEAFAKSYEDNLCIGHYFLLGAEEAVMALSKKYRLFLASNGTAKVQAGRLTSANLYRFFEKVYVSQELGANKPSIEFFERAFAQIPDFDKEKAIMVGDSLTSDIQGGIRAGIRTCWVNPEHLPGNPAIRPDYEIESITQLEALLEEL
jgi:2-haloacid dehalogenase